MNKCILIGNLTKDPELSTTSNGIAVCRFSIAVGRKFANAGGERETDFFNIIVWRNVGENCHKFLKIEKIWQFFSKKAVNITNYWQKSKNVINLWQFSLQYIPKLSYII